jgi:hypothetical protein
VYGIFPTAHLILSAIVELKVELLRHIQAKDFKLLAHINERYDVMRKRDS